MFLASNELDLSKVTEWSAKSWQLSAVATIWVKGADARFHTDSQQGLQVGVDRLQVVEPLVPAKQHFQMLIMS